MKKLNFKFLSLISLTLLFSVFLFTGCTKQEKEVISDTLVSIGNDEPATRPKVVEDPPAFFSADAQEIGVAGEYEYKIIDFGERSMGDFHRIIFTVESVDGFARSIPNVLAAYRQDLDSNSIRLTLNMIAEDDSGIEHQGSADINVDVVERVYRNVLSEDLQVIYDIGVNDVTRFKLHSEPLRNGDWSIILDIEYLEEEEDEIEEDTGEVEVEDEVTVGDGQSLDGATSADGARITAYSYGVEGGVFKFVWTVRGSSLKPTPKVQAKYNASGDIIVVFPDLESDYIARDSNEFEVGRFIEKISWSRTGDESMYKFDLNEKKDFELKSSLNPNQIILEIKLY